MNKKEIYQIILQHFDDTLPLRYRSFVKRWLLDKGNKKEKDEALHLIWDHIDVKPNKSTYKALHQVHHRLGIQSSFFRSIRSYIRYAALILLLFSVTVGALKLVERMKYQRERMEICNVPDGQLKTIYLSDGSIVKLNSGSDLRYPKHFKGNIREVYLQGEAVFTIRHDSSRPFRVHVGNLMIKDLGTCFNVKAYQRDLIITTLAEGKVSEQEEQPKSSASITLSPGEQSIYCANSHQFTKEKVDVDSYMAWTEGNLIFDKSPLSSVIADVAHHFNVKMNIGKDIPKSQLFTTQFSSSESLTDVLGVLAKMGNFKYKLKGKTVYLTLK